MGRGGVGCLSSCSNQIQNTRATKMNDGYICVMLQGQDIIFVDAQSILPHAGNLDVMRQKYSLVPRLSPLSPPWWGEPGNKASKNESEKAGSYQESNPGHPWLSPHNISFSYFQFETRCSELLE